MTNDDLDLFIACLGGLIVLAMAIAAVGGLS